MLLFILGARRKDANLKIDIANVLLENRKVILLAPPKLKHSVPQGPIQPFIYQKFKDN